MICNRNWIRAGTDRSERRRILGRHSIGRAKLSSKGFGFIVKGEVGGCDQVALKGDDPPVVVIGELKLIFYLEMPIDCSDREKDLLLALAAPIDQRQRAEFLARLAAIRRPLAAEAHGRRRA